MSRKRIILPVILLTFAISCLKAKKSPFDMNSSSGAGAGFLVAAGIKPTSSSSNSSSVAPNSVSYGGNGTYKMFAGVAVNYTPTSDVPVESWSIRPDLTALAPELTFDTKTGSITGTPSTRMDLTTFTITAKNGSASKEFTIQLQVFASGQNVWTVMGGLSGGDTSGGNNTMLVDPTSNVLYFAGQTGVNLDGLSIPNTGGSLSGFVSKYDLDGNRIWTKAFGIPGSSGATWVVPEGITKDSAGNIYISGFASTGMLGSVNITATTAGFIVKFDSNGNQLWINSSAPTIRHEGYGIALDSSGDVYLSTLVSASSLHQTNNSWTDAGLSIVKYNGSTGAYMSSVMLSSAAGTYRGIQSYGGMVIDSSGNVYITGSTRSSAYCGTNTTSYNPALIRLNSSLTYLGCTAVPAVGDHAFAFSLHVDNTGAYMSGYFTGSSLDGVSRTGTSDAFLTKFSLAGTKLWTRVLGVASKDTAARAIGYSGGNIFISGMTGGNLQGNVITGQKDMFVAKYDSSGTQIWLKMQGIQNDTVPCGSGCGSASIAFDSSGTLYSTASTNGSIGGITNPAGSNLSFFLVRNVQ